MENAAASLAMVLQMKECVLKGHLGEAGSSCYLVESIKWGQLLVCKQVDIQRAATLGEPLWEFLCLQSLVSSNVISMYEFHCEPHFGYMFLEFCPNGSLADYLRSNGPLDGVQLLRLMKTMLSVVDFMHSKGVAHRDIKPANLLLGEAGQLKVADFGISRIVADDQLITGRAGTTAYMAPELWGTRPYDPFKADIWALGVTLFFAGTKLSPWKPQRMDQLPGLICKGVPDEAAARLPENVRGIIMRMLTTDPNKRPTAKELLEDEIFQNVKVTDGILKPKEPIERPLTLTTLGGVKFRTSPKRKPSDPA